MYFGLNIHVRWVGGWISGESVSRVLQVIMSGSNWLEISKLVGGDWNYGILWLSIYIYIYIDILGMFHIFFMIFPFVPYFFFIFYKYRKIRWTSLTFTPFFGVGEKPPTRKPWRSFAGKFLSNEVGGCSSEPWSPDVMAMATSYKWWFLWD